MHIVISRGNTEKNTKVYSLENNKLVNTLNIFKYGKKKGKQRDKIRIHTVQNVVFEITHHKV